MFDWHSSLYQEIYTKSFSHFFYSVKSYIKQKEKEIFIVILCLHKHQEVASLKFMYNGSFIRGNFQHHREDEYTFLQKKLTFLIQSREMKVSRKNTWKRCDKRALETCTKKATLEWNVGLLAWYNESSGYKKFYRF